MEFDMKEWAKMVSNKVMENWSTMMEPIMKVISIMTKLMEKEFSITGKTVQLMTDNGLINDSTVTDNFSIKSPNN